MFRAIWARQQYVPEILRKLMLHDKFDPMSPTFTVRDVTSELFRLRLTSRMTGKYLRSVDH